MENITKGTILEEEKEFDDKNTAEEGRKDEFISVSKRTEMYVFNLLNGYGKHSPTSDKGNPEPEKVVEPKKMSDKFYNISTAMNVDKVSLPRVTSPRSQCDGRPMTPRRRQKRQSQRMLSLSEARGSFFVAQEDLLDKRLKARRKISRIFRFVNLVCSLCIRMQQLSRDLVHDDVISQLYYYSANGVIGESGVRKLAFDPGDFSRRKMARLPVWARNIACKDPRERSEAEVDALCRLLKGVKSFQEKFTEGMRRKICKAARYSSCEKGRVLVRQGHIGYNFYFLYSGSAFVQKEKVDEQTGKKQLFTENIIDQGACFGELALISDGGKRTATIICREPTELFQIDRDTFDEICPNIFSAELEEKIKVALLNPMFQSWPSDIVTRVCFQSHIKSIPYGKVIEKDWSKASHVYFVIKGSIKLLKKFTVPQIDESLVDFQLEGMMGRPLPWPRYTETDSIQFASVGHLRAGDHSDLRVLTELCYKIPYVIMVSQGTEVLRMTVSMLIGMVGKGVLEDYIRNHYKPIVIPNELDLYKQYLKDSTWETFKGKVVRSVKSAKERQPVANIASTSKGTSGWARWPGQTQSYPASTRLGTAATCCSLLSDKSLGISTRIYSTGSSSDHHRHQIRSSLSRFPETPLRVSARDVMGRRDHLKRMKPD